MGAVADAYNVITGSVDLDFLKAWLRIDYEIEDVVLTAVWNSVLDVADAYLNNDFNGGTVPNAILNWCLRETARVWELRTAGMTKNEIAELGRQEIARPINWTTVEWGELRLYRRNPGF